MTEVGPKRYKRYKKYIPFGEYVKGYVKEHGPAPTGRFNPFTAPPFLELYAAYERDVPPRRVWGRWTFNKRSNALTHKDPFYEVDLDGLEDAGEMLHWIMHVSRKTWMTVEDKGHLVEALNDIAWRHKPQPSWLGG
jgi:hypothetical protein